MSQPRPKRTVIITGASTGIGRAAARYLRDREFRVLGGVRSEADAESLASEGIEPLLLDVTDAESIARASESAPEPIFGLVNNAGVSVAGPLELVPVEVIRRQLEVNVLGPVATTRAFLPRIRASRGRIVNISSISGRVALPLLGPYAMSKFALEAFTDALRREMIPFGVEVVSIQPGAIDTPIWEKSIGAASTWMDTTPADLRGLYQHAMDRVTELARERAGAATPVDAVSRVIHLALTAPRPRTHYLVGADAKLRARLERWLPKRTVDGLVARYFGLTPAPDR